MLNMYLSSHGNLWCTDWSVDLFICILYNLLVFYFQIHAKISDYGIARFSAYEGLKAQEGTLAYRAPEVTRKENYSFEVAILLIFLQ